MTADDPVVTVLMTVRNGLPYIDDAIESIRHQTIAEWELVIVDDGSDDDTPRVLDSARASDDRVRPIRLNASRGTYAAANVGVQAARGRYVARMDADDVALPNRLETHLSFLRSRPHLRAVAGRAIVLAEDGSRRPVRIRNMPTLPGAIRWGICVRGFLQGASMIETDALLEVGGYRELPASQDHRLWCDLSRRGWLGAQQDDVLLYREHDAQMSHARLQRQRELACDAVRDHLCEMAGEDWDLADIGALRTVGFEAVGLRRGEGLLKRFHSMWSTDPTLSVQERREISAFTRAMRYEHRREWVRRSLQSNAPGRMALHALRWGRTLKR